MLGFICRNGKGPRGLPWCLKKALNLPTLPGLQGLQRKWYLLDVGDVQDYFSLVKVQSFPTLKPD